MGKVTYRFDSSVDLKFLGYKGRVKGVRENKNARRREGVEINNMGFGGVIFTLSPILSFISFPTAIVLPRSLLQEVESEVGGLLLFLPLEARLL